MADLFAWVYDQAVCKGRAVNVARLDDMSPEAEADRRSHTMLGNKSVLAILLCIGSRAHRLLTLDARKAGRDWPAEVAALQRREA